MKKILTVENMRLSDKNTIATKIPSKKLMASAAKQIFRLGNFQGKIGIVCGSGNNAGDGYALAILLYEDKKDVTIVLTKDKFSQDGKYFYDKCQEIGIKTIYLEDAINITFDTVVDALLGTGFKGVPSKEISETIKYINKHQNVISIDINSGLNGDNGRYIETVKSMQTISIGYYKPGHFLNDAKDVMKTKINGEIGINPCLVDAYLLEKEDVKSIFPKRKENSHKGTYGTVAIIGGSKKYPGAIRLANLSQTALYSGCGISKIICPSEIYDLIFSNVLETVITSMPSIDGKMIYDEEKLKEALEGVRCTSVGVGWDNDNSSEYQKILSYLINDYKGFLIIDADGINTLSKMDLSILKGKKNIILTPHIKELSRLTSLSTEEILDDPLKVAKEFVTKYEVTLLVKGPTTIVASKDNTFFVETGNSGMATAGSGDVLTGVLTGIFGMNDIKIEDISFICACGAYINGYAGDMAKDKYGEVGMVSSDTARFISFAIKEITK